MFRKPGSPACGKNSLKRNAWNSVPRSHGKAGFVVAGLHAGHRVLVRSHLFAVLGLHVVMRTAGSSSFRVSGGHLVAARTLPGRREPCFAAGADEALGVALWAHDMTVRSKIRTSILYFMIRISLSYLNLHLRADARSESRQTPPRRSWLLVLGIRALAPARSAAKNCA